MFICTKKENLILISIGILSFFVFNVFTQAQTAEEIQQKILELETNGYTPEPQPKKTYTGISIGSQF